MIYFNLIKASALVNGQISTTAQAVGQLQQRLMNLVINAGEAIGDGNPGRITVTTSMADIPSRFTDELGEEIPPGRQQ